MPKSQEVFCVFCTKSGQFLHIQPLFVYLLEFDIQNAVQIHQMTSPQKSAVLV